MADSRQLPSSIDVVAPADGFILARNISPGQHFEHATEFYRIADLSRVWVVAEVYEQEAPYLRAGSRGTDRLERRGTPVVRDALPTACRNPRPAAGPSSFVWKSTIPKFVLRPEMLVDVELPVRLPSAVTVPLDALVDSGARARVYVEHGAGVFEPREVETGWRAGERVEIRHGVRAR